jgi:hypothetical protein
VTRIIVATVVFVGCSDHRSPRKVVEAVIEATNRRDVDGALALFVSPGQLSNLVACTGTESPWLTPEGRAEKLAKIRSRHTDFSTKQVRLLSFEEEDRDEPREWVVYKTGATVDLAKNCVAKTTFAKEKYRIELVIEAFGKFESQPSLPVQLWRVDDRWYLWSDPLD